GYTSLGYLSALTVHELKIDKSFVADLATNPAHAAIVRSIVDLGHNLGLSVVGEGVETAGILTSLRRTGCDIAQGYLLARPMPAELLADWLHAARPTSERTAATPTVSSVRQARS
ncbi:MAG TPA: EAL domain-containing protein, partial [Kineosporiaceae bacterium]|nr:EAL domain-containing protein [Kineosporiaceae bacterium]